MNELSEIAFSVMMLDVDDLKLINDVYGHYLLELLELRMPILP